MNVNQAMYANLQMKGSFNTAKKLTQAWLKQIKY